MEERWWAAQAWLPPGRVAAGVLVTVEDGVVTAVEEGVAGDGATRLGGLVLPGLANAHSHVFHRALRGRTQADGGDFWSWRRVMYDVAARLDPDRLHRLARAAFAEMVLAGITRVGEFHYLHHGPGGVPYDDPNAMSAAVEQAADEAGVRLTLLDTCYLTAAVDGAPLEGPQRRFGDGDAEAWATRVAAWRPAVASTVVGAAIHSVRAVPAGSLPTVAGWAAGAAAPLHLHLSEQPAENEACLAVHGCTPTALLDRADALGERTVAVHATHLTDDDIALLAGSGTGVCMCPTTERDLADGIGRARELADAGVALSLGSDSHAVVDLIEEARAMEADERLATGVRGRFTTPALMAAMTVDGHRALGCATGGAIAVGAPADLVAVRLDSVRTAGADPARPADAVLAAATAADVTDVVQGGRVVVVDGHHMAGDVGAMLAGAIEEVHR